MIRSGAGIVRIAEKGMRKQALDWLEAVVQVMAAEGSA
jgi:hypothetical protein